MSSARERGGLYRSRHGLIFGVCQGIADWRELPVWVIRLGLIVLMILTAVVPFIVGYLVAGVVIPLEPPEDPDTWTDRSNDRKNTWNSEFKNQ
jgi:phage shock protein C